MENEIIALVEAVRTLTEVIQAQQAQCVPAVVPEEIARGMVAGLDGIIEALRVAINPVGALADWSELGPWKANPFVEDGSHLLAPTAELLKLR